MNGLSLITLNSNGIRHAPKRRALLSKLKRTKADFYMLQETHSIQNDKKIWRLEWGAKVFFSHGRSNSKGVAILFDRGLSTDISKIITDDEGRFIIVQLTTENEHLTLVNVYAPTNNDPAAGCALMDKLNRSLTDLEIHSIIIAGDFNTKLDTANSPGYSNSNTLPNTPRGSYAQLINALLEDYDLVDIWKKKNPTSKRGTFHRNAYSSRLDYIFVPEYLLPSVNSICILPEPLSDHCLIKWS